MESSEQSPVKSVTTPPDGAAGAATTPPAPKPVTVEQLASKIGEIAQSRNFSYLSRMYQPPKGTKFSALRLVPNGQKNSTTSSPVKPQSSEKDTSLSPLKPKSSRRSKSPPSRERSRHSPRRRSHSKRSSSRRSASRERSHSRNRSRSRSRSRRHGRRSPLRLPKTSRSISPLRLPPAKTSRGSPPPRDPKTKYLEGFWKNVSATPKDPESTALNNFAHKLEKIQRLGMTDVLIHTAKVYAEASGETSGVTNAADAAARLTEVLDSNYACVLSLRDISSEKRIASLVNTMTYCLKRQAIHPMEYEMHFAKYVSLMCEAMGWDDISPSCALLVDLTDGRPDLERMQGGGGQWFTCQYCPFSYPAHKFPCAVCGEQFTLVSELYVHDLRAHNNLLPCYECATCGSRFAQVPEDLVRHEKSTHLCPTDHEPCHLGGCARLIPGGKSPDVMDHHRFTNHVCRLCGDLFSQCKQSHDDFFHSVTPRGSLDFRSRSPEHEAAAHAHRAPRIASTQKPVDDVAIPNILEYLQRHDITKTLSSLSGLFSQRDESSLAKSGTRGSFSDAPGPSYSNIH